MASLRRTGPDSIAAGLAPPSVSHSSARRAALWWALAILLAAALRLPGLALRPMHADEAVHADKLGTLLEGGGYAYDPFEYHGPTLYYLTLLPAWLRGQSRYVEIDEVTLRLVPAALGVALVALHAAARGLLGAPAAVAAALLCAVSPAMVFYSRYYIHELPLVLFSFGALLAACAYLRRPSALAALAAGACVGLMYATKETALLALGAMAPSFAIAVLAGRGDQGVAAALRARVRRRDAWLALGAGLLVASALMSSLLQNPGGVVDSLRAYAVYAERAGAPSWHIHPWDYYLGLLVYFPTDAGPLRSELLILALALFGAFSGWSSSAPPGADPRALRFLALYTLALVVVYAAIPYKTPWCLLGFLHGMILLAGAGAVFLVRLARGRGLRLLVGSLLLAAAAQLAHQAWAGSFRFAADPRNPYVYAHTGNDVFVIVDRLRQLARAHPQGSSMPLQIVSRQNLWPLPFYLRAFAGVEWWNGVAREARNAPVVLVTPDLEAELTAGLYERPPPGERELYVSAFERPVELRPGVELRGYATLSLWERARGLESIGEPPWAPPRP